MLEKKLEKQEINTQNGLSEHCEFKFSLIFYRNSQLNVKSKAPFKTRNIFKNTYKIPQMEKTCSFLKRCKLFVFYLTTYVNAN